MTELDVGSLLLQDEQIRIVESINGGSVELGLLGAREVKPKYMFDVDDDCPLPTCDGTVVEDPDNAGRRYCSDGCLQWEVNHLVDGDECETIHCDDGEIYEESASSGQYSIRCDSCETFGFGPEKWRESWWDQDRRKAIEYLQS